MSSLNCHDIETSYRSILIAFIAFLSLATNVTIIRAEEVLTPNKLDEVIPQTARFNLNGINNQRYTLVGRLSIERKFMGSRANPPYHESARFHSYNGELLKFSSFTDAALEKVMLKSLAKGNSIPVMLMVRFESTRVGHDGRNISERIIAHIEACKKITAESICSAAEAAGSNAADSLRYMKALKPDIVKNGIGVSLGTVTVKAKPTPRGAALSIKGIKVINATSKPVTIKLVKATLEQGGKAYKCLLHQRSRAPLNWEVEGESWSDGVDTKGAAPRNLWMFNHSGTIDMAQKVTLKLELKLNGSDTIALSRTMDAN